MTAEESLPSPRFREWKADLEKTLNRKVSNKEAAIRGLQAAALELEKQARVRTEGDEQRS